MRGPVLLRAPIRPFALHSEGARYLQVVTVREVPVRVWQTVDAVLGNLAAVERIGGDADLVAESYRLQNLGWDAAAEHPGPRSDYGWPADGDHLRVDLSSVDVKFIVGALERSRAITLTLLGDPEPSVRVEQSDSLRLENQALAHFRS